MVGMVGVIGVIGVFGVFGKLYISTMFCPYLLADFIPLCGL